MGIRPGNYKGNSRTDLCECGNIKDVRSKKCNRSHRNLIEFCISCKKKISGRGKYNKCISCIKKGNKLTNNVKRKIRLSCIESWKNRTESGQIFPAYNSKACEIIDEYGKKHGYRFQHAMNGGEFYIKELGYWVDGYDTKHNAVIEYYEKYHRKTTKRDRNREKEIVKHLNCKFIIIREWKSDHLQSLQGKEDYIK
tara:strand:+ start:961 stop:1548 length:588 start_codon:yes stop_codon:yes gene_type:complete